jgi:hypothetical protein
VRLRSVILIGCAAVTGLLTSAPARAQRHDGAGLHHPYYSGFAQWYPYPYPILGIPGVPIPDHAVAVRLQVVPREAFVYVDGFAAGVVDDYDGVFQRLRLVPGPHEIVIYHPGHRTLRQSVYYNPGSSHTIRHTLNTLAPGEAGEPQPVARPFPPPGTPPPAGVPSPDGVRMGMLSLRVQPPDATILVDDEPWKGPASQDRLVIQLPEGSHRVRVEKTGFQTFAVGVDVRAGETASLNVSLFPFPPP